MTGVQSAGDIFDAAGNLVVPGARMSGGTAGYAAVSDASGNLSFQPGLALLASTAVAGYTLVNGTGTIPGCSWTAPNDGNLHRYTIFAQQAVTVNETGGELAIVFTSVNNTSETQQFSAAALTTGIYGPGSFSWLSGLVRAGTTLSLTQFTALTAGASTFWAEIWGL